MYTHTTHDDDDCLPEEGHPVPDDTVSSDIECAKNETLTEQRRP